MKTEQMKSVSGVSQKEQLSRQTRHTLLAVGIGVVLLIVTIITSTLTIASQSASLSVANALNQYRLGSKALTQAVQTYAVTGDEAYYDAYFQELEVDMNRDKALSELEERDILDEEWDKINAIAALSDGLVPLEEEAMQKVKEGD